MLKNLFNFKHAKSLSESIVFYGVAIAAWLVLSTAAQMFLDLRF